MLAPSLCVTSAGITRVALTAKEWTEILPETCQKLIESMPRRIQAVKGKGGSYKVLDCKIIEGQKMA